MQKSRLKPLTKINPVRNSRGVLRSTRKWSREIIRAVERRGIISNGIEQRKRLTALARKRQPSADIIDLKLAVAGVARAIRVKAVRLLKSWRRGWLTTRQTLAGRDSRAQRLFQRIRGNARRYYTFKYSNRGGDWSV